MPYNCDVKIMAVKPRRAMVLEMCEQMGLKENDVVIYDDRPSGGGTLYTCKKCWKAPAAPGVTHRVVLQDDLFLCDDFINIINRIVNTNPEFIFSLFCSRVHFEHALPNSPYVIINGWNSWGQGMMMPLRYVKPMFEFADRELGTDFQYDDAIYTWWAQQEKIPIATTVPSTIQHRCPTQSTLGYNNKQKISKVWAGFDLSNVKWEAKSFAMSPRMPLEVSLEEQKKRIAEKGNKPAYTIFRKGNSNVFDT